MLRKELAFNGVVLTDDLALRAVSDGKAATLTAAVDAVRAGADMLLVGRLGDDDQAADVVAEVNRKITSKVCTGEIDIGAIERSVDRIQKLTSRWTQSPSKLGQSRALFGSIFFAPVCRYPRCQLSSVYAQNSPAQAWKSCQSSDADQRLGGCSLVISQGAGGSKTRLADALDGRCWAYHVKGSYDLAVADCKASIALRPNYPYAFSNLASAYLGQRKFEEALSAADRAIELKPDFLWSHLNRARAYSGLGRTERELNEYQAVLAIDPNNAEAKAESKAAATQVAESNDRTRVQPEGATPSVSAVSNLPPVSTLALGRRIALIFGNSRYQDTNRSPNCRTRKGMRASSPAH